LPADAALPEAWDIGMKSSLPLSKIDLGEVSAGAFAELHREIVMAVDQRRLSKDALRLVDEVLLSGETSHEAGANDRDTAHDPQEPASLHLTDPELEPAQ
jgi:hypothetical protein